MVFNKTTEPFETESPHKDLIHQVSFDYHGWRMATCSSDQTLAVWDKKPNGTWTKSAHWKVHGGVVWRVVWAHPEFGQLLATCSYDRSVCIWEEIRTIHEGKPKTKWVRKANIRDSRANVTDIAFAPRHLGLQLATVSTQGLVRVYEAPDVMDLSKWPMLHERQAFLTRCGAVCWSPSRVHKPLLAVASDEKKANSNERIVIYELTERKCQRIASLKFDLPFPVVDIAFSPISLADQHQFAIAAGDIYVYSIKIPQEAFIDEELNGRAPSEMGEDYGGEYMDDDDEDARRVVPAQRRIAAPRRSTGESSTEYSAAKVTVLGDLRKAWRIRYDITGTSLTATSNDGTVRVWKSFFMNRWTLVTEMAASDYVKEQELPIDQLPVVYY